MTTEPTNIVTSMYPRLVVADATRAIEFYVSALGAVETARHTDDNGKIIHSELKLGTLMFAVKDEDGGDPGPTRLGGSPVILALDVTNADAVGEAMIAAGATVIYPIQDWDYGARAGRLADPFGHLWMISEPLPGPTS
jgi:PhnB protein